MGENIDATDVAEQETTEVDTEGSESGDRDSELLGENGMKALKSERQSRKAAERRITELENQISDLGKSTAEQELDRVRAEAATETRSQLSASIVHLAVKQLAQAKGVSADLAARLIDTAKVEVGVDGSVDSEALETQLDELVEKFPELGAKSKVFGSADQGARSLAAVNQVTRADLDNMTPAEITQARREGRLDDLLGVSK